MPTYEYECKKCGYRFEAFQSMAAVPLSICPECRGKVNRLRNKNDIPCSSPPCSE